MLYMVQIEVPAEVGTRVDFEEQGPGQIIGYMMNRFTPEAVYIKAGTRASFIVADLNETQMTELMLIVSKNFGTYPEFTAIIPAAAIPEMAGKAIEAVKKAQI